MTLNMRNIAVAFAAAALSFVSTAIAANARDAAALTEAYVQESTPPGFKVIP